MLSKKKRSTKKHVKQRYHLGEKNVRSFPAPAKSSRVYYDDTVPGFGLRVTYRGTRSWVLNYYAPSGYERRLTIGRWAVWTAGAAREQAKLLKRRIDLGEDPLAQKQEKRRGETFADLCAECLDVYAVRKRDGGAGDRRFLEVEALPVRRRLEVRDITRADVIRLLDKQAAEAPVSARRLHSVLRKVFSWGVERGLLEVSPCLYVKAPGGKQHARDRVLTLDECTELWRGFTVGGWTTHGVVTAARLVLVTAQRPGEVCGAAWAELDFDEKVWTIPAARTKNGRTHRAPLTRTALELLAEARRHQEAAGKLSRWVFPSPRGISRLQRWR